MIVTVRLSPNASLRPSARQGVWDRLSAVSFLAPEAPSLLTHQYPGTSAQTVAGLQQAAVGVEVFSGTAVQSVGGLRQAVAGAEVFSGTSAQKVVGLKQAAAGTEVFSGTSAQKVVGLKQAAAGTEVFSGTAAQRVGGLRQAAAGAEVFSGTSAQKVAGLKQAAVGAEVFSGTVAQHVSGLRQAAVGAEVFSGMAAQHVVGLQQAASGMAGTHGYYGTATSVMPTHRRQGRGQSVISGALDTNAYAYVDGSRGGALIQRLGRMRGQAFGTSDPNQGQGAQRVAGVQSAGTGPGLCQFVGRARCALGN